MREMSDRTRVVVPSHALCTALDAVYPHAGSAKDAPGLERVRLVLDPDAMLVAVTATDISSRALATVTVQEAWDGPGEHVDVDLSAPTAALITRVHGAKVDGDALLELVVDAAAGKVRVTDVSGLLPGRSLTVYTMSPAAEDGRTDVTGGLAEVARQPLSAAATLTLAPSTLRQWGHTAKAIGSLPMRATTTGEVVVVAGDHVDGGIVNGDSLADEPRGWSFLGCTWASGTSVAQAAPHAYDGELLDVCDDLAIDDEPQAIGRTESDGEAAVSRVFELVTGGAR